MNFGFLIFPDVEELDFIGPWEIIGMWSKYYNGPEQRILVSQTGEVVQCAKGLKRESQSSNNVLFEMVISGQPRVFLPG